MQRVGLGLPGRAVALEGSLCAAWEFGANFPPLF